VTTLHFTLNLIVVLVLSGVGAFAVMASVALLRDWWTQR
jgi:hypothetical protein